MLYSTDTLRLSAMHFFQLFDNALAQYTYILACEQTKQAIVIDPLRDLSPVFSLLEKHQLTLVAATETHIHADFLSGCQTLSNQGIKIYLSEYGGDNWQYQWPSKSQNTVHWLKDQDTIQIGTTLTLKAVHSPGHTPEHIHFEVFDGKPTPIGAITGDFLFVDDMGRPDLPEKAANETSQMQEGAAMLFRSIQQFQHQSEALIIWPGHGQGSSCGKNLGARPYTTWGYEKKYSRILQQLSDEKTFCKAILHEQTDPPLYFSAMKKLNRDGFRQHTFTPCTERADLTSLQDWAPEGSSGIICDLLQSKTAFMQNPIPSALFTPLAMLSTAVGSLVKDLNTPLLLLAPSKEIALIAQKQLYNIGFDQVVGYITEKTFENLKTTASAIPVITFAQLKTEKNASSAVLDVRTSVEFAADGFDFAENAPYQRLGELIDTLPKNKSLYVHCQAGGRAAMCASLLHAKGFKVTLVDGAKPKTL